MNFDVPTFSELWDDPDFKDHQNTDFEGVQFLSFEIEKPFVYLVDLSKIIDIPEIDMPEKEIHTINQASTQSEIEKFLDVFYEHFYKPPPYSKPGRILVEIFDISENQDKSEWEYEVLDYDSDSGVFWIPEGEGFDYWLDQIDFTEPGKYLIENIVGHYYRGDGWTTDDDVHWDHDDPVRTELTDLL